MDTRTEIEDAVWAVLEDHTEDVVDLDLNVPADNAVFAILVGQVTDALAPLVAHIRAEALREAANAWRQDGDIVVSTWLERRADREEQGA